MTPIRGARKYQDGPPVWTRPEAFAHASWPPFEYWWPGELKPLLQPLGLEGDRRILDNRGVLLTTERMMHAHRGYVLGWVGEMLGLRQAGVWQAKPPPFLSRLVRDFYREDGNGIAFVIVEASRDSIRLRHRGFKEVLQPARGTAFQFGADGIEDRIKIPLLNGIELSTGGLHLVPPEGRRVKDTHFTRMKVERVIEAASSPKPLKGQWTNWCLASQDADREALSRGFAPAGKQLLLHGSVNAARLMTWMKIDIIYGHTHSYALDMHPESGSIFAVRHASVPLKMHIELDPWLDDWLLTAIRSF
jgi:hypothetical protein